MLVLWFTLTSPEPLIPEPRAPTAEQVGAARDAYRRLRAARGNKGGVYISLGAEQLDALGALASHGFRPDRFRLSIQGRTFRAEASHSLPIHRWLNLTVTAQAPSATFPPTRMKIGALTLPELPSRWVFELGRWFVQSRRGRVPPLEQIVRNLRIENGRLVARISLPPKSGLIDQMAGVVAQPAVDGPLVAQIYCAMARDQKRDPSKEFAQQVQRAFSPEQEAARPADFNRAAFVALGMLLVDERVGDFAGSARDEIRPCKIPTIHAQIYGRTDWTAHWALSAAIAVGTGVQLSEAAGEWKELADSLARNSRFAAGDPSGFSMADIAADRAGFLTARAAVDPASARRVATQLAKANSGKLLAQELVQREDGLTNAEFVKRYGGVDDARFRSRIAKIDAVLASTGAR